MDSTVEQIRSRIEFINQAWKSGHTDRRDVHFEPA
jgi:hypothetical protein